MRMWADLAIFHRTQCPVSHHHDSILPLLTCLVEIVRRIRAMANKLLPVQVEISDISDATSSIITPEVIEAFANCGGDFGEAVPFC